MKVAVAASQPGQFLPTRHTDVLKIYQTEWHLQHPAQFFHHNCPPKGRWVRFI